MDIKPFQFSCFEGGNVVASEMDNDETQSLPANESLQAPVSPPSSQQTPPPAEQEPEAAPGFTQEDLDAARREGEQDGYQKGLTEGKGLMLDATQQLTRSMTLLQTELQTLMRDYNTHIEKNSAFMSRIAIAIAQKITMEPDAESYTRTVHAMLAQVNDILIAEPKIEIDIPASLKAVLDEQLTSFFNEDELTKRFSISIKDELSESDYKMRWSNGGIERSQEAIWQEIEQLLHTQRVEFPADDPQSTDICTTSATDDTKIDKNTIEDSQTNLACDITTESQEVDNE